MTPHQIDLVRRSFALLEPQADAAAALFYDRLFSSHPELRPMFRGDMHAQGAALMRMIAAAIRQLDRPDVLVPLLQNLGARHAGYGVHPTHYDLVGAALLATLRAGLGAAFTAEVEDAWATMYGFVSRTMQGAKAMPAAA